MKKFGKPWGKNGAKRPKKRIFANKSYFIMKFFQVQGKEIELAPPLLHSYVEEGAPILLPQHVFLNSRFLKRP